MVGIMTKEKKDDNSSEETSLYEVGYHVLPIVSEENLSQEVAALKDIVEKHGGMVLGEEFPRAITLAYPISKAISHKRTVFASAYFGWMRFRTKPEEIQAIDEELRKNEKILRFLLLETQYERPLSPKRMPFLGKGKRQLVGGEERVYQKKVGKEPTMTEEELDKTIEELIT